MLERLARISNQPHITSKSTPFRSYQIIVGEKRPKQKASQGRVHHHGSPRKNTPYAILIA